MFERRGSKEVAKGIAIPVIADPVLGGEVFCGSELTGIYFDTIDDQYGRITFENLDSLKVCRGEVLPYETDWKERQSPSWVYRVENSLWQQERYSYEKKFYGTSYEFDGNVEEMRTDFGHYVFQFHDEFVEVIARGFWFEQDTNSLFKQELQEDHPFWNCRRQMSKDTSLTH